MRHAASVPVLVCAFLTSALCGQPRVVAAQEAAVPAPDWVRSIELVDDGVVVHQEPRPDSPRRGTARIGTRMPLRARLAGRGCPTGYWYRVGARAFICEHDGRYSPHPPMGVPQPEMRTGARLPFTYAFVGFDGTRAFARPSDYEADQYVEAFGRGFGIVVMEQVRYHGISFVRTRRGLWVDRDSLRFARGSDYEGVTLDSGDSATIAWVRRDGTRVRQRPRGRVMRRARRRERVHVLRAAAAGTVELSDGTFVRARDLSRVLVTPMPESVGPDERWLDVDVSQQVMVAYQGATPVYATLVSTGRQGRHTATPIGEFRVWVKLATSDMDDLERDDVVSNYSVESVPWVQYFEGSNGFHTAFWHDDFGARRSHGCVNLSPADARWLFDFTAPRLPAGWTAALPTDREPGTLVRVHDGPVSSTPGT